MEERCECEQHVQSMKRNGATHAIAMEAMKGK